MPASLLPATSRSQSHPHPAPLPNEPVVRPAGKPWPVSELSAHIGMSERQLWRWIKEGKLRAIRIGTRVFISDSVVQLIVENGLEK